MIPGAGFIKGLHRLWKVQSREVIREVSGFCNMSRSSCTVISFRVLLIEESLYCAARRTKRKNSCCASSSSLLICCKHFALMKLGILISKMKLIIVLYSRFMKTKRLQAMVPVTYLAFRKLRLK